MPLYNPAFRPTATQAEPAPVEVVDTTEEPPSLAESGIGDGADDLEVAAEVVEADPVSVEPVAAVEPLSSASLLGDAEATTASAESTTTTTAATTAMTTTTTTATTSATTSNEGSGDSADDSEGPEASTSDYQLHHPESILEDHIFNDPDLDPDALVQQSSVISMAPTTVNLMDLNFSLLLGRPRYTILGHRGPYPIIGIIIDPIWNPMLLGN